MQTIALQKSSRRRVNDKKNLLNNQINQKHHHTSMNKLF